MMKKFILALISMSLLLASGCAHIEEYDTEETADTEETTEVQTVTVDNPEYYTRFKNDGISINVYNWGEYIPDGSEEGVLNLNAEFTKLTGITVNYSTYATNEELYAKLKGGGSTYDIIIPSDKICDFFLICFLLFTIYTLHITSALFMLQSHYTFFHLIYNSIFLKILLNFCVQSVKSRHRNILLKLTDIPLFRNNRSWHTLFPYRYRHSFRLPGCLLHDIFFLH